MKDLKDIVTEKLRINKDTTSYFDNPEFYFTCTVDEIKNDMGVTEDDVLEGYDNYIAGGVMHPWGGHYNLAKPHGKNGNTLWYAAYCYILHEGPKSKKDILNFLKPGSPSQYAETFTSMRAFNVIESGSGKERGLCIPQHPKDWKTP